MSMRQVGRDVPSPGYGTGTKVAKYDFSALAVGDTVAVPFEDRARARSSVANLTGKTTKQFQTWRVEGELYVKRLEDARVPRKIECPNPTCRRMNLRSKECCYRCGEHLGTIRFIRIVPEEELWAEAQEKAEAAERAREAVRPPCKEEPSLDSNPEELDPDDGEPLPLG